MKAIALYSGGLDSTLCIKIITNQGIAVTALHFINPLSRYDKNKEEALSKKVKELGADFKSIYLGENFIEILKNPKFGYGKNLNPCIDCKILMLAIAKKLMPELGASFVITGEVIAQRPKSQHRETLELIEKRSGLEGLILRPLSAKLLKETIPESKGWVKREALFDFNGRSRTPQIELAKMLGIEDYQWPAGGCLLTVPSFCSRVEDFLKSGETTPENLELLKWGKHFRLSKDFKLIVGRNEEENKILSSFLKEKDISFEPKDVPGPFGLGRGVVSENIKNIANRIIARYADNSGATIAISIKDSHNNEEVVRVSGLEDKSVKELLI
ncbi:MAG: 7-cyano-7-deazaguanine synthase [Candidatus Omnitrophota bacterium]|jgi:tRNA U34 2-thiouridine synthase MnmA/TrmU